MVDTLGSSDDEPGTGPSARETAIRRPLGVSILAVLYALGGIILLLSAAATVTEEAGARPGIVEGVVSLLFGLVGVALAYGLWVGLTWGWYGAVIIEVAAVVTSLLSMLAGDVLTGFVGLVIAALILWYLFQARVQAWFGVAYGLAGRYGRPT